MARPQPPENSESRFDFLARDYRQGFPAWCGFEVDRVAEGLFVTRLDVRPEHRQQDGFIHAGVMATMADHTAGYAAYTVVDRTRRILTVEFKINFLRPADGAVLICRSEVIKPGRQIVVAESEVTCLKGQSGSVAAKAMVTLASVAAESITDRV